MVDIEHIRDVVEDPELITQDAMRPDIENYYAQEVIAEFPDLYVKVCVLFKEPEQGRVITAFGVDWPKPEEEIVWQK